MTERTRVDRLLDDSGLQFTEEPLEPLLHAIAAWRFRSEDVEADVYIVDADPGTLAAELKRSTEFAGYNGAIVFAVRYTGSDQQAGWYKAAQVTSALAGEE